MGDPVIVTPAEIHCINFKGFISPICFLLNFFFFCISTSAQTRRPKFMPDILNDAEWEKIISFGVSLLNNFILGVDFL